MNTLYQNEEYYRDFYKKNKKKVQDLNLNFHFNTNPFAKNPECYWKVQFSNGKYVYENRTDNMYTNSGATLENLVEQTRNILDDYFGKEELNLTFNEMLILFNIEANRENIFDIEIGGPNFKMQTDNTEIRYEGEN